MKAAAEKLPLGGLALVQNGARKPAGADRAIDFPALLDQIEKRGGSRRAVGIDVANEIGIGSELETLNQGSPFADGGQEFESGYFWKIGADRAHDSHRIINAAIQDDDDLKFSGVFLAKETRVVAQNRLDPQLFVVSRNEQ